MLNRNVVARYSRDLSRDRHLDLFLQQSDAPRAVVLEPEIHQLVPSWDDVRVSLYGTLQPHRRKKRVRRFDVE